MWRATVDQFVPTKPGADRALQSCSPATGFGDIRRNAFRGPDCFNTDLTVRKNFRITEHMGLQLGANAYNVLNHPNFQNPVNQTGFGPGTFGNILQTTARRPRPTVRLRDH